MGQEDSQNLPLNSRAEEVERLEIPQTQVGVFEVKQPYESQLSQHGSTTQRKRRMQTRAWDLGITVLLLVVVTLIGAGINKKAVYGTRDTSVWEPSIREQTQGEKSKVVKSRQPLLILVSIDGFKPSYLSYKNTPNLLSICHSKEGALCPQFMRPSFPSSTFPNHYTIVTGLYPESHGIVGNVFYDPQLNDTFVYKDPKKSWDSKWWKGEPIWVSAEKQGIKTAVYMWPGSTTRIQGILPTYLKEFKMGVTAMAKFQQVVEWTKMDGDKRPGFIATYIPEVDQAGHGYGPNSVEVEHQVKIVDKAIGYLRRELVGLDYEIMVVSDHGMTTSRIPKDYVYIEDLFLDEELVNNVCGLYLWPIGGIVPCDPAATELLYNKLKQSLKGNKKLQHAIQGVYLKHEIPERLHYSSASNQRIPPILILSRPPFIITSRKINPDSVMMTANNRSMGGDHHDIPEFYDMDMDMDMDMDNKRSSRIIGTHGYDNVVEDMQAMFISSIQIKNTKTRQKLYKKIKNVDLYNLMCLMLDITPAPNNGTTYSISNHI